MTRKIGKVRQAKFRKNVTKLLEKLGAKKVEGHISYYDYWAYNTVGGKLTVRIPTEHENIFSIFGRFEEVEKAKVELNSSALSHLNIHSGKWNFHFTDEVSFLESYKNLMLSIQ